MTLETRRDARSVVKSRDQAKPKAEAGMQYLGTYLAPTLLRHDGIFRDMKNMEADRYILF